MSKKIDRTGITYGKLTAIKCAGRIGSSKKLHWNCQCSCGRICVVDGGALQSGNTISCGCVSAEILQKRNFKHGYAKRSIKGKGIYNCWRHMRERCENENCKDYKDYGDRGITVCERWMDFKNFIEDMGERPTSKHSIDRIDTDGNYFPENCKWATNPEQQNNKRNNRRLAFNGKSQNAKQWSVELSIPYQTILWRLKNGRSIEQALTKTHG